MRSLDQAGRRKHNAEGLKKSDLIIAGDGTSFPATVEGEKFAMKYAKKFTPRLSVNLEKKTESGKPKP